MKMILIKSVYGILLSTIIIYNKVLKHLTDHRFTQNKYNMCTFNKMVKGKEMTVKCHVDDLKVSHTEQPVLDNFLDTLSSEFGQ